MARMVTKPAKPKKEANIVLDNRVINGQYIYSRIDLDKETLRKNRSTGSILKYVLTELPKRIGCKHGARRYHR